MSYAVFCGANICISHQAGATSDKHFVLVNAEAVFEHIFSEFSSFP
jgi:hypothetical protein